VDHGHKSPDGPGDFVWNTSRRPATAALTVIIVASLGQRVTAIAEFQFMIKTAMA
jgi:hypothetical protein